MGPTNKGGVVPREQWRSRSKKSAVQRKHKLKTAVLAKNLEKVENIQYQKERSERDRVRVNQGAHVAGHHNLPEILKEKEEAKKQANKGDGEAVQAPSSFSIGFLKPEVVRARLQSMFDVEKED
eukprot:TRINITY_DN30139_c0_g1_i1.p1 TRINITY_DN30139_c0_g1~~TRINITY_DN30139_c0_g1_i1.p1  ORF type:complete len:142 (+),score=25.64 TRINITY_DN30139_c0_g1_i1:57-428(+)